MGHEKASDVHGGCSTMEGRLWAALSGFATSTSLLRWRREIWQLGAPSLHTDSQDDISAVDPLAHLKSPSISSNYFRFLLCKVVCHGAHCCLFRWFSQLIHTLLCRVVRAYPVSVALGPVLLRKSLGKHLSASSPRS